MLRGPRLLKKRVVTKDQKNEDLNPECYILGACPGRTRRIERRKRTKLLRKEQRKVSRRYFHKEAESVAKESTSNCNLKRKLCGTVEKRNGTTKGDTLLMLVSVLFC